MLKYVAIKLISFVLIVTLSHGLVEAKGQNTQFVLPFYSGADIRAVKWLPDSKSVTFFDQGDAVRAQLAADGHEGNWWVYNVDTGVLRAQYTWPLMPQVTPEERATLRIFDNSFIYVSPDARYLIYAHLKPSTPANIYDRASIYDRVDKTVTELQDLEGGLLEDGSDVFDVFWDARSRYFLIKSTSIDGIVGVTLYSKQNNVWKDAKSVDALAYDNRFAGIADVYGFVPNSTQGIVTVIVNNPTTSITEAILVDFSSGTMIRSIGNNIAGVFFTQPNTLHVLAQNTLAELDITNAQNTITTLSSVPVALPITYNKAFFSPDGSFTLLGEPGAGGGTLNLYAIKIKNGTVSVVPSPTQVITPTPVVSVQ